MRKGFFPILSFFVFFSILTVNTNSVYAQNVNSVPTESDRIEPGPDLTTLEKTWENIEIKDLPVIHRTYTYPNDQTTEVHTVSLQMYGAEHLFLKIWNIQIDSKGFMDDANVLSALWLPDGRWFMGDVGEYPDVHFELGFWGYNLVIHVKKLHKKYYEECVEEKKLDPEKNCDKFFYDKTYNGMYISIPIRKYNK